MKVDTFIRILKKYAGKGYFVEFIHIRNGKMIGNMYVVKYSRKKRKDL